MVAKWWIVRTITCLLHRTSLSACCCQKLNSTAVPHAATTQHWQNIKNRGKKEKWKFTFVELYIWSRYVKLESSIFVIFIESFFSIESLHPNSNSWIKCSDKKIGKKSCNKPIPSFLSAQMKWLDGLPAFLPTDLPTCTGCSCPHCTWPMSSTKLGWYIARAISEHKNCRAAKNSQY